MTGMAGVHWGRVAIFYAIALGGAAAIALLLWTLLTALGATTPVWAQLLVGVLYMPMPLIAGLIVERLARRRHLLAAEWSRLRRDFWTSYLGDLAVAVPVMLGVIALGFGVAWLGGALAIPGAGHLAASQDELAARLVALFGQALPAGTVLPPIPVMVASGLLQGLVAGVTLNAVFAFGEEYGWRGVLADELAPLGNAGAAAVTGVLWGFWHTPIILLGHNYGAQWAIGIPLMIAWCLPLAFVLTWVRRRRSVLAAAVLHGCYNGLVGMFTLLVVDGSIAIALPMGLLMAAVLTAIALVLWLRWPLPGEPVPAYSASPYSRSPASPSPGTM